MILAVVAACAVTAGCERKSSLYLEPGRPGPAARPAPSRAEAAPPKAPPPTQAPAQAPAQAPVQMASQVTPAAK
jgi:hypothetical protein